MHMWHHVTNHLIIFNDKDSNSENRITLRVRDSAFDVNFWYVLLCNTMYGIWLEWTL
jgi:hypothetical protein